MDTDCISLIEQCRPEYRKEICRIGYLTACEANVKGAGARFQDGCHMANCHGRSSSPTYKGGDPDIYKIKESVLSVLSGDYYDVEYERIEDVIDALKSNGVDEHIVWLSIWTAYFLVRLKGALRATNSQIYTYVDAYELVQLICYLYETTGGKFKENILKYPPAFLIAQMRIMSNGEYVCTTRISNEIREEYIRIERYIKCVILSNFVIQLVDLGGCSTADIISGAENGKAVEFIMNNIRSFYALGASYEDTYSEAIRLLGIKEADHMEFIDYAGIASCRYSHNYGICPKNLSKNVGGLKEFYFQNAKTSLVNGYGPVLNHQFTERMDRLASMGLAFKDVLWLMGYSKTAKLKAGWYPEKYGLAGDYERLGLKKTIQNMTNAQYQALILVELLDTTQWLDEIKKIDTVCFEYLTRGRIDEVFDKDECIEFA